MRIGILGSGEVGRSLGQGFSARGDEVVLGTRSPDRADVQAWATGGPGRRIGTFEEAATIAEVAVLATRWSGTMNAIGLAGPENLSAKVVIDVTNPLVFHADGPPTLDRGHTDSGGEQVQRWLRMARVVKAFSTVGSAKMVQPSFTGGPPDMFVCGDDVGARRVVAEVCQDFGWGVIDLGAMEAARYLEPMAMIWILEATRSQSGNHAFKLLRA